MWRQRGCDNVTPASVPPAQRDRIAAAGVSVRVMRRGDIFHQRAVYDLHQLIQAAEACK